MKMYSLTANRKKQRILQLLAVICLLTGAIFAAPVFGMEETFTADGQISMEETAAGDGQISLNEEDLFDENDVLFMQEEEAGAQAAAEDLFPAEEDYETAVLEEETEEFLSETEIFLETDDLLAADEDIWPLEGTCGENAFWTLAEDGELTIWGSGEAEVFLYNVIDPWVGQLEQVQQTGIQTEIKKIIIGSEITRIGDLWSNYVTSYYPALECVAFEGDLPAGPGMDIEKAAGMLGVIETPDTVFWERFRNYVAISKILCPAWNTGDVIWTNSESGETLSVVFDEISEFGGKCGANVDWFVSMLDGLHLIFEGEGEMEDYVIGQNTCAPWTKILREMSSLNLPQTSQLLNPDELEIVIDDRITRIGTYAFDDLRAFDVQPIHLPRSLQSLGRNSLVTTREVRFHGEVPEGIFESGIGGYPFIVVLPDPEELESTQEQPQNAGVQDKLAAWKETFYAFQNGAGLYGWNYLNSWYYVKELRCSGGGWCSLTLEGNLILGGSEVEGLPLEESWLQEVRTVIIGSSVSKIHAGVFSGCSLLELIILNTHSLPPRMLQGAFTGCDRVGTIVDVDPQTRIPLEVSNELIQMLPFTTVRADLVDERTGELIFYAKGKASERYYTNQFDKTSYASTASVIDLSLLDGAEDLREVYVKEDAVLMNSGNDNSGSDLTFYVSPGSSAEKWCELRELSYMTVFENMPAPGWQSMKAEYEDEDGGLKTVEFFVPYIDRKSLLTVRDLTFDFANTASAFGYPSRFRFPVETIRAVFSEESVANALFSFLTRWKGNCFGMCAASILKNLYQTEWMKSGENTPTGFPRLLLVNEETGSNGAGSEGSAWTPDKPVRWYNGTQLSGQKSLADVIERLQISQYSTLVQDTYGEYDNRLNDICLLGGLKQGDEGLFETPFLVTLGANRGKAHVMTAYALLHEYGTNGRLDRLYVYDPNCPGEKRYILIERDDSGNAAGWTYRNREGILPDGQAVEEEWTSSSSKAWISAIPADVIMTLMNGMGQLTGEQIKAYLTGAQDLRILDAAGEVIALIAGGEFVFCREDIRQAVIDSESEADGICFYLPADGEYTFENLSPDDAVVSCVNPDGSVEEIELESEGTKTEKTTEGDDEEESKEENGGENGEENKSGNAENGGKSTEEKEKETGSVQDKDAAPFLSLNARSVRLKKGQSTTGLKVSMLTGDRIKSVKSSKKKIVSASIKDAAKGIIRLKGKKTGKATVIITLKSGLSGKVKVKVQKSKVKTKKLRPEGNSRLTLKTGQTYAIRSVRTPFTAQGKITYTSSNRKVAAVNKKGVLKARGKGSAKITVRSGKKKYILTVLVSEAGK